MGEENNIQFTEAESIEFGRRWSEANSVILAAPRLFECATDSQEQIKESKKVIESYWFWLVIVGGGVLASVLQGGLFELNVGAIIVVGAMVFYAVTQLKLWELDKTLKSANDKLYDLERIWFSAIGDYSFWEMKPYIDDLASFDYEYMSEEAAQWSAKQRATVITVVCGWEKANRIAEYERGIMEKYDKKAKEEVG